MTGTAAAPLLRSGVTRAMATAYYHWFFLPSGNGLPEHLIGALADFLD